MLLLRLQCYCCCCRRQKRRWRLKTQRTRRRETKRLATSRAVCSAGRNGIAFVDAGFAFTFDSKRCEDDMTHVPTTLMIPRSRICFCVQLRVLSFCCFLSQNVHLDIRLSIGAWTVQCYADSPGVSFAFTHKKSWCSWNNRRQIELRLSEVLFLQVFAGRVGQQEGCLWRSTNFWQRFREGIQSEVPAAD